MADYKFYTNPMSRGQIVRWALHEAGHGAGHEAGAGYEQILLDYAGAMKAEEYLAINPMGKVPALAHNGKIITECAAICAYLADNCPDAGLDTGLAPTGAERADYYRWLFFAAGPLEQAITHRNLGITPTAEQERMVGYGNYDRVIDTLDKALENRDYICGARFTMADVYVGAQVDWGLQFGTIPERASFISYAERLRKRPKYKEAKAVDQALIEAAQSA